jgi:hypothetical protein
MSQSDDDFLDGPDPVDPFDGIELTLKAVETARMDSTTQMMESFENELLWEELLERAGYFDLYDDALDSVLEPEFYMVNGLECSLITHYEDRMDAVLLNIREFLKHDRFQSVPNLARKVFILETILNTGTRVFLARKLKS